jgi:citrate synthase
MATLKEKFYLKVGPMQARVRALAKDHAAVNVSKVDVGQVVGGARDIISMLWDVSLLDKFEGIRFRGYSIPELREKLPKAPGGSEPLPEGIFYLLLLGELPTYEDCAAITEEWRSRSVLPQYLIDTMNAVPKDTHPMTQFSLAILQLQRESEFARRYKEKMPKTQYWDAMYEDVMNLIAKLPNIAAYIFRRTYFGGKHIAPDPKLDWGGNLAHMLGVSKDPAFIELMRLYLCIHSDHEGGNVSAHTTHLVGSALSDAYYSLSAGMDGLAGPLHGLANQEVLAWIMDLMKEFGGVVPTKEQMEKFMWDTLNGGRVIPGYGHAVLRKTDPRYVAQREFALKHLPDYDLFRIVSLIYEVAPDVLTKHGKTKNPWPNVDAHSGVLLYYYGASQFDFYTVFFGVSRALGVLAQLIWDRALGLPIERPKSVTTEWLENFIKEQQAAPAAPAGK